MKRVNQILVVFIFALTAVLIAVAALRAYDVYETDKRLAREQEELEIAQVYERNKEAQSRVGEMEAEIYELTKDKEELRRFIDNIQNGKPAEDTADETADGAVSGNDSLSENDAEAAYDGQTVSGNGAVSGNTVSGNTVSGNTVSGNTVSGNTVSGNTVSGNTVSGNTVSGNAVSENTVFGNGTAGHMTLAERRQLRSSMEETQSVNREDREHIAGSHIDFSGKKIACLGDSITAASNLENEENYQQYSYPSQLKEVLGAEEVYNLGIGGSSIGRYWLEAYVDRYREIPEDVDIIIVMGGTNDGFCASEKEFGSLDERAYRTFCGDLDELMRGLREDYPDADIFFATPLPNILHDYLMSERDYLLPQQRFVDAILTLADEYGYQVVDLYNANILDSHDVDIVTDYMPDGVHGNHEGYRILAEHFASELIRYYEIGGNTVSGSDADALSENSVGAVSGDHADAVSADAPD